MSKLKNKEEYSKYVDSKVPPSPILLNIFKAFMVGGFICSLGQVIFEICTLRSIPEDISYTIVSISLIAMSAFLTSINIFNKLGKFAGAGTLIPITGFANSIVSPAIEYKSEGYVMGVGAKMFTVAGPVLVYGISTSIIVGFLYVIFASQSITFI